MGCDALCGLGKVWLSVSIHAPVWGATCRVFDVHACGAFQSTHPCGVRLYQKGGLWCDAGFQSTHPCGVRLSASAIIGATVVSIHAPVWGATTNFFIYSHNMGFNPRTRVGCDLQMKYVTEFADVSIHAPVWGATPDGKLVHLFQEFQSTHPCGVRQSNSPNHNH